MFGENNLKRQLIIKINQKNRGLKLLIWGIALGVLNLILDGLYNALRLLSQRGDLGEKGGKIFSSLTGKYFLILLVFWLLLWTVAIVLLIIGVLKWLGARSEIEKIKLELEILNSQKAVVTPKTDKKTTPKKENMGQNQLFN